MYGKNCCRKAVCGTGNHDVGIIAGRNLCWSQLVQPAPGSYEDSRTVADTAHHILLSDACSHLLADKNRTKKSGNRDGNRNTNILLRKFLIVLIGSVVLLLVLRPVKSNHLMAVLDVGQGDGIYVRLGEDTNLFLDGGSTDVSKVGTYRILPFLKAMESRR